MSFSRVLVFYTDVSQSAVRKTDEVYRRVIFNLWWIKIIELWETIFYEFWEICLFEKLSISGDSIKKRIILCNCIIY